MFTKRNRLAISLCVNDCYVIKKVFMVARGFTACELTWVYPFNYFQNQ